MCQATTVGFVIAPILGFGKDEWILPTKSYVPYSVSKILPYAATYLQQTAALFYAVMLNVSFDSLVYGFTIHACAKWSTLSFLIMSQATAVGLVMAPILGLGKGEWFLPTKSYVPYSISEIFPYVATYLQQAAALFYAIMLNVSFDSLVYGFTIHACGQIEYAVVFLIYEFTILDAVEVIRTRDHIHELTEGLFLGLTFLTLSVKYANFLLRENKVSELLDYLRIKMCQPKNSTEQLIMEEHNRKAKWSTVSFMMISFATGLGFMITPALGLLTKNEHVLPLKSYIPYSVSNLFIYLATYLQQFITLFYGIMLNVSFDSLIYGFIIHTCAQIELMCHRLTENLNCISSERKSQTNVSIEECVRHHLLVKILTRLLSFEFLSMLLYLSGMLLQLFYYCWYGNELELKSKGIATAIYSSDWTKVTPQDRKSLIFIMINSQKGIMFSYHGIFALSLNTFTWICRTSYSAYNLLQQASN
ncbi:Odorant receptor 2a [Camponotus floridanus]|uniref:Odorant receptor n=1 Tax=Camponotus floridanus TaxID=104421 RepID=E2A041_CAMFO|nr:Odorant receptor 2a [Camponotus floridanus]